MSNGVDYSDARPDLTCLAEQGYQFAVRYVGPGTADKHLTADEAQALTAAGLSIVCVAEGVDSGLLGGYQVGHDWATSGHAMAVACGMPQSRPVHLAVDFQCSAEQWPAVRDALRGACDALGVSRVGVYGDENVVEWAARDGVASWFWQTYAWSTGQLSPHATLYQWSNNHDLCGGNVDYDRSITADFGQWTVGGTVPPQTGGEDMPVMRRNPANGGVYVCNYVTRRHVTTIEEMNRLETELGQVVDTDTIDDYGIEISPDDLAFVSTVKAAVAQLVGQVDQLGQAVTADPVAIANAIANRPEIARTLAELVAQQLGSITGSITLSGELAGRVAPART